MPDQAPPTPEGCVHGPWWDEDIRKGGCWCYSDGELSYAWLPSFSTWVVTESAALRELLRLAHENALQKQALIDLSQHNADLAAEVKRLREEKKQ